MAIVRFRGTPRENGYLESPRAHFLPRAFGEDKGPRSIGMGVGQLTPLVFV
jgi:hypothetical protein